MTKKDKATLETKISIMEDLKGFFEDLANSEREKFDNLSEGLQQTENNQKIESNADDLDNAVSDLDSAITSIQNIVEN